MGFTARSEAHLPPLIRTMNKIQERVRHYNDMNEVKAFFKYQIISDEIEELFGELDNCLRMFSVSSLRSCLGRQLTPLTVRCRRCARTMDRRV